MSWTDERVATLTKLWADGLSASQIAGELGGVTRNAVIGKVHRLGLSGRAKPASSSAKRAKRPASGGYNSPGRGRRSSPNRGGALSVNTRPVVEDMTAPESLKLELVDLKETSCRWPDGDPASDDFHFCGHKSKEDSPYCEYHSKVAYQPTTDRRRVKTAARA